VSLVVAVVVTVDDEYLPHHRGDVLVPTPHMKNNRQNPFDQSLQWSRDLDQNLHAADLRNKNAVMLFGIARNELGKGKTTRETSKRKQSKNCDTKHHQSCRLR
jgi:hypothetical protein